MEYKLIPANLDKQEYADILSSRLKANSVGIMPTTSNIKDIAFKAKTHKIDLFFEEAVLVKSVLFEFTVMTGDKDNELIAIIY